MQEYSFITAQFACPQKNTKCAKSDNSNVISTVTTEDDSECGSKEISYL